MFASPTKLRHRTVPRHGMYKERARGGSGADSTLHSRNRYTSRAGYTQTLLWSSRLSRLRRSISSCSFGIIGSTVDACMSERTDDRMQQMLLLRAALRALNSQQKATYQRWIGNAHNHSLQLDLKHHLSVATTVAKGLPSQQESDEIIDVFRRVPKLASQA